jgi:hypothetical protein
MMCLCLWITPVILSKVWFIFEFIRVLGNTGGVLYLTSCDACARGDVWFGRDLYLWQVGQYS